MDMSLFPTVSELETRFNYRLILFFKTLLLSVLFANHFLFFYTWLLGSLMFIPLPLSPFITPAPLCSKIFHLTRSAESLNQSCYVNHKYSCFY